MISLPILANLNIGYRKAAAPNKGAAAFFYSTDFYDFHRTALAGIASKKALLLKRTTVPAMANKSKLVEKWLVLQCGKKSLLFWKNFFQKTQDLALPNWDRE